MRKEVRMQVEYQNRSKVLFDIEIQSTRVPAEADYWGYYMKATERETALSRVYTAMVKKDICSTQNDAESFIMDEPLRYLKSVCLDSYEDGSHLLFWPDLSRGWVVI